MTNREFFEAVANNAITDEVIEKAQIEVAKLEERKIRDAENRKAKAVESENTVFAALTDEPQTAAAIGEIVGYSTAKTSAALRRLIEKGMANRIPVKSGTGSKTTNGYTIADTEE